MRCHGGKVIGLFLVLSTLLVYWQVQQFDFVNYDDGDYVTDNRNVNSGLTAQSVVWAFTKFLEEST